MTARITGTITEQQPRPHGMVLLSGSFATKAEAEAAMDNYCKQWHPEGYGTRMGAEEIDGRWVVTGHRYDSAD